MSVILLLLSISIILCLLFFLYDFYNKQILFMSQVSEIKSTILNLNQQNASLISLVQAQEAQIHDLTTTQTMLTSSNIFYGVVVLAVFTVSVVGLYYLLSSPSTSDMVVDTADITSGTILKPTESLSDLTPNVDAGLEAFNNINLVAFNLNQNLADMSAKFAFNNRNLVALNQSIADISDKLIVLEAKLDALQADKTAVFISQTVSDVIQTTGFGGF
jgi:hypothetical protein